MTLCKFPAGTFPAFRQRLVSSRELPQPLVLHTLAGRSPATPRDHTAQPGARGSFETFRCIGIDRNVHKR